VIDDGLIDIALGPTITPGVWHEIEI